LTKPLRKFIFPAPVPIYLEGEQRAPDDVLADEVNPKLTHCAVSSPIMRRTAPRKTHVSRALFLQRRELMNSLDKADRAAAKRLQKICYGEPMSTMESGFEWPVPSSIKLDGFHCHRRGGCDRKAFCEGGGECLGVDPPLANALSRSRFDEIVEGECLGVDPPLANALNRNRLDEIAEMIHALTYAEMIEFARGLLRLRGGGKVNGETLPKILHAWATEGELASGKERKFWPINTAPKDRIVLTFMLGQWRIARWKHDHPHKRPIPFWSADDLGVTVSRTHQPKWWAELPPSPQESGA
jgi:hypothetical protein